MLRLYYDLARNPPTYDFVAYLMQAEVERQRVGAEKVELAIIPGPANGFAGDRLWPPPERREAHLQAIVLPMAGMLPGGVIARHERRPRLLDGFWADRYVCGLGAILAAYREGIRPLRVEAPPPDPRLVTITLREAEHWPRRNSQIDQWVDAAHHIEAQGFRVALVPDTARSYKPIPNFAVDRLASISLCRRAILYRQAACNLFISNGPAWFALALDAPVLMLRPTTEGAGRQSGQAWFAKHGVKRGEQLPGAPAWQRLVWEDDTSAAIVRAFDEYMAEAGQWQQRAA